MSAARVLMTVAALLAFAVPAQAHGKAHGLPRAGAAVERGADGLVAPSCPPGVPVQTITIVDQANVRPWALAKVERAVSAQSLQLRAAWGTPCVQFEAGGWPLYLKGGSSEYQLGVHSFAGKPYADVWTGGLPYLDWSTPFSHEVMEMSVDPTGQTYYTPPDGSPAAALEVADPVEERSYRLDGVWVSDFALPSYFAGAQLGVCFEQSGEAWCEPEPVGGTRQPSPIPVAGPGPLIAPAGAAGPYDEMGVLTAPWQTTWEQPTLSSALLTLVSSQPTTP